jgi:GntR family transcriptional regulator
VERAGRPAHVEEAYYPVDLARGTAIAYHDTGDGGIYERLAERGARPDHFQERVVARTPTAGESQALRLKASVMAIMEITRTAWSKGRPVA